MCRTLGNLLAPTQPLVQPSEAPFLIPSDPHLIIKYGCIGRMQYVLDRCTKMLALSQPTSLRGSPAASRRGGGLGGAGVSGGIGRQPGISQSYNTSPSGHRTLIDDYSGNCVNPYFYLAFSEALSLVNVIRCAHLYEARIKAMKLPSNCALNMC